MTRAPVGTSSSSFDEDGTEPAQLVHHVAVVDDFLADVNRRAVEVQSDLDHVDSAHDTGAESARAQEDHFPCRGAVQLHDYEFFNYTSLGSSKIMNRWLFVGLLIFRY